MDQLYHSSPVHRSVKVAANNAFHFFAHMPLKKIYFF